MNKLKLLIISFAFALSACDHENREDKNGINSGDNEIHMCSFDLLDLKDASSSKPDAAIINWPKWTPGQTIRIKFLNGDSALQERVKECAQEWTLYANLIFQYVPTSENADIRISFRWKNDGGSWSLLGMNSVSSSPNYQSEPSMNFGWTSLGSESTTKREVLHEFGHALGLIHETKNPVANIPWNLPKVYKYYADLMGFTKEQTDDFVINKAVLDESNYSEYDKLSIMHYYIDPALTLDGIRIPESKDLSLTDMTSINKWYPFPARSTVESTEVVNNNFWIKPIKSPNGIYQLQFENGFLSIVDIQNKNKIWEAGKTVVGSYASFERGNLIISKKIIGGKYILWRSGNSIYDGLCNMHLQDDGNLVISHDGIPKWSSKTGNI